MNTDQNLKKAFFSILFLSICYLGQAQESSSNKENVKTEKEEKVVVSVETLKDYVGTYEFAPGMNIAITKENDKLYGQPTRDPKTELIAKGKDKFEVKNMGVLVKFNRGEKGKIVSMAFYQDGKEFVGKKQ